MVKKKPKLDKYDRQIARLTKKPEQISKEWFTATGIFQFCGADKEGGYGCLTMIRAGWAPAPTPKLTEAIKKDRRIPKSDRLIKARHLPVFAEWQRKIDKMGVR